MLPVFRRKHDLCNQAYLLLRLENQRILLQRQLEPIPSVELSRSNEVVQRLGLDFLRDRDGARGHDGNLGGAAYLMP